MFPASFRLTGVALGFCGYSLSALQDAAVKRLVVRLPVFETLRLRSAMILGIVPVTRRARVVDGPADIATLSFAAPVVAVALSVLT